MTGWKYTSGACLSQHGSSNFDFCPRLWKGIWIICTNSSILPGFILPFLYPFEFFPFFIFAEGITLHVLGAVVVMFGMKLYDMIGMKRLETRGAELGHLAPNNRTFSAKQRSLRRAQSSLCLVEIWSLEASAIGSCIRTAFGWAA